MAALLHLELGPLVPLFTLRIYAVIALAVDSFVFRSLMISPCHHSQLASQEQHLHVASADSAPGFVELAHDIADKFGMDQVPPKVMVMDNYNNDWDTIYPFSAVSVALVVPMVSRWLLTTTGFSS